MLETIQGHAVTSSSDPYVSVKATGVFGPRAQGVGLGFTGFL